MSDKRMTFEEWLAYYNTVKPLTDRDRNNLRDGWHAALAQAPHQWQKWDEKNPPMLNAGEVAVMDYKDKYGKREIGCFARSILRTECLWEGEQRLAYFIIAPSGFESEPEKSEAEKAWEEHKPTTDNMTTDRDLFIAGFTKGQQTKGQSRF